nr:MAG TPA: hypothetical protein [Caudoviricetes sp.]
MQLQVRICLKYQWFLSVQSAIVLWNRLVWFLRDIEL